MSDHIPDDKKLVADLLEKHPPPWRWEQTRDGLFLQVLDCDGIALPMTCVIPTACVLANQHAKVERLVKAGRHQNASILIATTYDIPKDIKAGFISEASNWISAEADLKGEA